MQLSELSCSKAYPFEACLFHNAVLKSTIRVHIIPLPCRVASRVDNIEASSLGLRWAVSSLIENHSYWSSLVGDWLTRMREHFNTADGWLAFVCSHSNCNTTWRLRLHIVIFVESVGAMLAWQSSFPVLGPAPSCWSCGCLPGITPWRRPSIPNLVPRLFCPSMIPNTTFFSSPLSSILQISEVSSPWFIVQRSLCFQRASSWRLVVRNFLLPAYV